MKLKDLQIRKIKPLESKQSFPDGHGLSLLVFPNGGKYWNYSYRFNGRQKSLRIGVYPDISLQKARIIHREAREKVRQGIDPAAEKQATKQEQAQALANTFQVLTIEWHGKQLSRWKPNHAARVLNHFEIDVFPLIGREPVSALRVKDIQLVLDKVAARGVATTAEKIRQWIANVFNYAAILEKTDGRNPAALLRGYVVRKEVEHMPALPKEELTEFYQRLLKADISRQNFIAVLLVMLVFVRSTELRGGEWAEINWQAKIWTVPACRMKRPREHVVPLSDWVLELLQELHGLTGQGRFMFPSRTDTDRYISEGTLNKIINNMGYKGIATPHGFRSLASSVLNEHGFNPDAIERQLAHVPNDKIRAAYNRAEYMKERAEMMQWYSDLLQKSYNKAIKD